MKTYKVVDPDACPKHLKICQYKHVAVAGMGYSSKVEQAVEEEGLVSLYDLAHDWSMTLELLVAILKEGKVKTTLRSRKTYVDEVKAIDAIETLGLKDNEILMKDLVSYMYSSENTIRKYLAAGKLKVGRRIGKFDVFTYEQACALVKVVREDEAKKKKTKRVVNEVLRKKHRMDKAEFIEKIVKPARKLKREYEQVYARLGEKKGFGGDDEEAGFRGE